MHVYELSNIRFLDDLRVLVKRLESDLHAKAEAVEKLHNDEAKMFATC